MHLALAYNLRHSYANADDPQSQLEADFDDIPTINTIIRYLNGLGHDVIRVEANERAYGILFKNRHKIDLLLNYSLGLNGKDRYSHIPAFCEMLKIPYTGPGPLAAATIMNKARAKEVMIANNISTLPFQLFGNQNERLKKNLKFPIIVKPNGQGCSAGITNKSVVKNAKELVHQVKYLLDLFHEPVLAEPFLTGREFSVGMLGNPPLILPIIESDHTVLPADYLPIDSLEVKWQFEVEEGMTNLICPAKIEETLRKNIENICLKTWYALDLSDLCRIDLRCDDKGNIYVLEVNSPPGLIPPEVFANSYFPYAARVANIGFGELLQRIINSAMLRYRKLKNKWKMTN